MSTPSDEPPYRDGAGPTTPLLSVAWRVLAALSALLVLGLVIGFALPGTWSVQRDIALDAPPDTVYELLDDLTRWGEWTQWSDVDVTLAGPPRGVGATMTWDDEFSGRGAFRIVRSRRGELVEYHVDVEGGLSVDGRFTLGPRDGGTQVTWTEEGDFGWNPLMSYAALAMGRAQGAQLERSLARLRDVLASESAGG